MCPLDMMADKRRPWVLTRFCPNCPPPRLFPVPCGIDLSCFAHSRGEAHVPYSCLYLSRPGHDGSSSSAWHDVPARPTSRRRLIPRGVSERPPIKAASRAAESICRGRDTGVCSSSTTTHYDGHRICWGGFFLQPEPFLFPACLRPLSPRGWINNAISPGEEGTSGYFALIYTAHGEVGFCANSPTTR